MTAVPHLSTRCPFCGDNTSMPPVSEPVLAASNVDIGYGRIEDLYAVLHLCTNAECTGSTVGYYTRGRESYHYRFHRPVRRAYKAPEELPKRPRAILQNANDVRKSPVACVTTTVRAVEAMMAVKGYCDRSKSLKQRINEAVKAGDLPEAMGDWAHEVRELGRETHTDEAPPPLPTDKEAEKALLFANTLAQYLFVLPARISKARKSAQARKSHQKK